MLRHADVVCVSCVHPMTVLNAVFCMTCSLHRRSVLAATLLHNKLKDVCHNSQSSSDTLIVISANIEDLTVNKASILSELCNDKHCHCLCLQETHRAKDQARPIVHTTNMEALFLLEMV